MEKTNLPELLKQPEYLKHYVKYKVWVEHKPIPTNLLKTLPYPMKVEILQEWNKEWSKMKGHKHG